MLSKFILAGLPLMVAANPIAEPQIINFSAVTAASSVTIQGAPAGASSQANVYNQASALAAASASASTVASAGGLQKRDIFQPAPCTTTTTITSSSSTKCASTTSSTAVISSSVFSVSSAITSTTSAAPAPVNTAASEQDCAAQVVGSGAVPTPDTASAFLAYAPFHAAASAAALPTGYSQSFKDLNASTQQSTYLTWYMLNTYDTVGCASYCDNTTSCEGFNVYYERDPTQKPAGKCTNPASTTYIKCALYGSSLNSSTATNSGQWQKDFEVVVAGSNGYDKVATVVPATPSGWGNGQRCGSNAHNHQSTAMGSAFFPGPFDVSVCAAYANAQKVTNYGISNLMGVMLSLVLGYNPYSCSFFNAYMLKQDGAGMGTYCTLFAKQYAPSAANYQPGWSAGHYYNIESSWSYCSA